jgi:hypothetical protein
VVSNRDRILAAFEVYRQSRRHLLAMLGPADSQRDPLSDVGEWLVVELLGGKLAANRVQRGHDIISPKGERIQVKTLANPLNINRNSVPVEFKKGVDLFAVVLFEDFLPRLVIVFRRGSLGLLNQVLGNRPRKNNPELRLELNPRHIPTVLARPESLTELGVQVFDPGGNWIDGARASALAVP